MSSELLAEKEEILKQLKENWPPKLGEFTIPEYVMGPDVDCIFIVDPQQEPLFLAANSDRAKDLYEIWEVPPDILVLVEDIAALMNSLPSEYSFSMMLVQEGAHAVKEIPLPMPLRVVH